MEAIAREAHNCNFYKLIIAWHQHLLTQNFDWGKLGSLQLAFVPYDLISDCYRASLNPKTASVDGYSPHIQISS